ncbi:MAG: tetratricopeptide repeat protein [Pseudomonadales bacterium]
MICWPDHTAQPTGAQRLLPVLLALLLSIGWPTPARAAAPIDAAQLINRAIDLIESGDYPLARTYLAPALIHPRLRSDARAQAYYLRGYSYQAEHLYVSARKDYYRALEFDANNGSAQAALAGLYLYGEGTPRDAALGVTLLQSALDNGQDGAVFHLGYAYLNGTGVEQDIAQGRSLLEQAAKAGDSNAMTHLGASYRKDFTDAPDPSQAAAWYDQAIAAGNTGAMVAKSYMLRGAELGEPDPAAARALIEQAAASGNANARISLSHLYLTGEGVAEDPGKAYALLAAGAQAPSAVPELHFRLGYLQQYGLGTDIDLAAAMASYRRAASSGVSGAMSRLAHLLMARSDDQSQSQAGYWLSRAAHSDSADAYNEYAWFLATTPVAGLRDGDLAVAQALKAVAQEQNANYMDTLAAAYAEAGAFTQAVATQKKALQLASEQQPDIVPDLQTHLAAYESGTPWREPALTPP